MRKNKKESFFWTSYSDLMTSLFFVMLLLFILVVVLLHNKMKATQDQLNKILEIEESVKNIDKKYFEYNSDFKRYTLKNVEVSFQSGSSNIQDIPYSQRNRLLEAGLSIKNFVTKAVEKNPDVKYILIVEGQASKDHYKQNYELSYERALVLVRYWKNNGLNFNTNNCEIIISGSGTESLFRVHDNEASNQRFVIHIIPKIGKISD